MDEEEASTPLRPGIILHVTVENFVTYSSASMTPGPHLNMLIGPNGTGKSTMVAAIILGLGGSPKHVGRGARVSEYVKHRCSDAKVAITLYDPARPSKKVVVAREFNLQDKSVWRIDGKKVSLGDVNEYKKRLNIQVDNLCQFLPQDRVQEFAKLNRQELLRQTQAALCRNDLTERRELLIKAADEYGNRRRDLEKNIEQLEAARDANARLEGKVRNFNKKKKLLGYVKDVDRKIAWKEYEEVSLKRSEIKEDRAKAKEILTKHKNSAAPTEEAITVSKENIAALQRKLNDTEKAMKVVEENISSYTAKVASVKEDIGHRKRDLNARLERLRQRDVEIETYTKKVQALGADRDEVVSKYGNEEVIRSFVTERNENIRKMTAHVSQLEGKKAELAASRRGKLYEKDGLEGELRTIEDTKQRRLEYLRKYDAGAHRAVVWLRENQLEFVGSVYEPLVLELNVSDPRHALYIENIVSKRDKVAFVCTEKQDMNLLIRVLRDEQNFGVNVLYSEDRDSEGLNAFRPRIPIEQLRKYGLFAYLNTLVSGPRAIMKYLCQYYRIHEIPVGDATTNDCYQKVPAEIRLFFSDKNKFLVSYSKYTKEKISKQTRVGSDGSLSISLDARKLEQIRSKLAECNRSCDRMLSEESVFAEKTGKIMEMIDKEKEVIKEVREGSNQIRNIESKIRAVDQTLAQLRSENVNEDDIREETNRTIRDLVSRALETQAQLQSKYGNFNSLQLSGSLSRAKATGHRQHVTYLRNRIVDARRACDEAGRLVDDLSRRLAAVTDEARAALRAAKDLSDGFAPDSAGFAPFREMYERLPDDADGLVREREALQARVGCLTSADDGEMQQYERRLELIARLEAEIAAENADGDAAGARIERLEREYVGPLEQLVGLINERFCRAYERMGCLGEVTIYKGDDPKDYSNYGISIKVSYRDGEPLQDLNGLTQSGGEKAVATATYMLSLQELTPVPFRCVDEINQGMDETNERRIFHLLAESTSQPDTAQYFLVTPKLIPKLKYVPSMKIHCVYNGPFMNLN